MSLDPTIYIIVAAVCALLSVSTAVFTLIAERGRIEAEKRAVEEQAKRVGARVRSPVTTKSDAAVRVQEYDGSMLQHT